MTCDVRFAASIASQGHTGLSVGQLHSNSMTRLCSLEEVQSRSCTQHSGSRDARTRRSGSWYILRVRLPGVDTLYTRARTHVLACKVVDLLAIDHESRSARTSASAHTRAKHVLVQS